MRYVTLLLFSLHFFIGVANSAERRIMAEDCEGSFTNHFLEKYFGPSTPNEADFANDFYRVTGGCHSGNYCAEMDAYTNDGNPHAAVGYDGGSEQLYNTENFFLKDVTTRYMFYRFWFKSTAATKSNTSGLFKVIYSNYSSESGPTIIVCVGGEGIDLYFQVMTGGDYSIVIGQGGSFGGYSSHPPDTDLYDGGWHQIEVYVDYGTDAVNGKIRAWIDDYLVSDYQSVDLWDYAVESNPLSYMQGWPGNTNWTIPGEVKYWFDDYELYADVAAGGEAAQSGTMYDGTIYVDAGSSPGVCGSANGVPVVDTCPSTDLCSTGTASAVTGDSDSCDWTCTDDTAVDCSAPYSEYSSVSGGYSGASGVYLYGVAE